MQLSHLASNASTFWSRWKCERRQILRFYHAKSDDHRQIRRVAKFSAWSWLYELLQFYIQTEIIEPMQMPYSLVAIYSTNNEKKSICMGICITISD